MARKMDAGDLAATGAFLVDTMEDDSITNDEWNEVYAHYKARTLPF